jgi:hypothetical protein
VPQRGKQLPLQMVCVVVAHSKCFDIMRVVTQRYATICLCPEKARSVLLRTHDIRPQHSDRMQHVVATGEMAMAEAKPTTGSPLPLSKNDFDVDTVISEEKDFNVDDRPR